MKPRDIASLSLALIAATVAAVLADLSYLWPPTTEPLVLVVVTVIFGFALRFVFARMETQPKWKLGLSIWLASVLAGAVSFLLLGLTCGMHLAQAGEPLSLGAEIGGFLGVALAPAALGLRSDWQRPLVDAFDRVLFTCAVLVAVVSGLAVFFEGENLKSYCASLVFAIPPILFVVVGLKTRIRARWLHAVIAGEVPSWSVIDRFEGDEDLPAIGDPLRDPGVLATGNASGGAFRATSAVVPVARVDRAGGYDRRAIIAFVCAAATLAGTPLSLYRRRLVMASPPYSFAPKPERFALGPTDDLAVGLDAVCAHRVTTGSYECWGDRVGYLLQAQRERGARKPTSAENIYGTKLWIGQDAACVLDAPWTNCLASNGRTVHDDGAVDVAFGRNFRLALNVMGRVTRHDANPYALLDVPLASAIAVRDRLGCVLTREGAVFCFGRTATSKLEPLHEVGGFDGQKVDRIAVREGEAWARVTTPEGSLRWYAWNGGEAVLRPAWNGVEELAGDLTTVCGRRTDDAVVCADGTPAVPAWLPGALGAPREVLPAGSALALAASSNVICARGADEVWCWGGIP